MGFLYFFSVVHQQKTRASKTSSFSLPFRKREGDEPRSSAPSSFFHDVFFSRLFLSSRLLSALVVIVIVYHFCCCQKVLSLSVTASKKERKKVRTAIYPIILSWWVPKEKRLSLSFSFLLSCTPFSSLSPSEELVVVSEERDKERKSTAPFGARLPTRSLLLSIEKLFQMESDHHHLFLLIILSSGVPS